MAIKRKNIETKQKFFFFFWFEFKSVWIGNEAPIYSVDTLVENCQQAEEN